MGVSREGRFTIDRFLAETNLDATLKRYAEAAKRAAGNDDWKVGDT